MDQGLHEFTVRLIPHAGDWRNADVVRRAAELNQQPWAMLESFHDGRLPPVASFGADGQGSVVVAVVKQAEDDDATVLRAYESGGSAAHARIEILERVVEADFGPNEIKTFRVPRAAESPVVETDLLEW